MEDIDVSRTRRDKALQGVVDARCEGSVSVTFTWSDTRDKLFKHQSAIWRQSEMQVPFRCSKAHWLTILRAATFLAKENIYGLQPELDSSGECHTLLCPCPTKILRGDWFVTRAENLVPTLEPFSVSRPGHAQRDLPREFASRSFELVFSHVMASPVKIRISIADAKNCNALPNCPRCDRGFSLMSRPNPHRTRDAMHNATQANVTCWCEWGYPHCTQATSKEKHSNLSTPCVPRPVWMGPWQYHRASVRTCRRLRLSTIGCC